MQLKQFYDIATKVSSRKIAATFGNLPDCSFVNIICVPPAIADIYRTVCDSGWGLSARLQ